MNINTIQLGIYENKLKSQTILIGVGSETRNGTHIAIYKRYPRMGKYLLVKALDTFLQEFTLNRSMSDEEIRKVLN